TQTTSVGEPAQERADSGPIEPTATETGVRPEEVRAAGVSDSSPAGSITTTTSPAETAMAASAAAGQSEQTTAGETKPGIVGLGRQAWLVGGLLLVGV